MIRVRFCTVGDFFDRDLPAVPNVGDTIRTYVHPGQVHPQLAWVDTVVWDIPNPGDGESVAAPVTVEVHLTEQRPKGK